MRAAGDVDLPGDCNGNTPDSLASLITVLSACFLTSMIGFSTTRIQPEETGRVGRFSPEESWPEGRGLMNGTRWGILLAATALLALRVGPARAGVTISMGNHPRPDEAHVPPNG